MRAVETGPLLGYSLISSGLDYYKPTMSQAQHDRKPGTEVTFELKNRGDNPLTKYVDIGELTQRLATFQEGWSASELEALARHQRIEGGVIFSEEYLEYLGGISLPGVEIELSPETGDIEVQTAGEWAEVTFWETIVMSTLNELYFEGLVRSEGLDLDDVYEEGDRRLSEKIAKLKERPDIKFAEFGTRRRFSYRWQRHVLKRLAEECPDNLIGTSNVQLAEEFNLTPIGTFAHEMPMVYAALADARDHNPLSGHNEMLRDWEEFYGPNLSTALTDTFGSEFFFTDFTPQQAELWRGLRHDSGDPFEFGERVIDFYNDLGIDPAAKTIVFSDGLDIDKIIALADRFKGRIQMVFGWGTDLTNDLGLKANNIVMKAVEANGNGTVKLSDESGKHTGTEGNVSRYLEYVDREVNQLI